MNLEYLQDIKNSIKYHRRDKKQLMRSYIEKRLNESLNSYYKTLKSSVYALTVADPEKVLKEME